MNPLRLGVFGALQQVRDQQTQRAEHTQALLDAREDKVHKRKLEDLLQQRQGRLDDAALHSRTLEDALHRAQTAKLNAGTVAGPRRKTLPSNAVEKMISVDNMETMAGDVQRSLADSVRRKTNATGRVFGVIKTPTWAKNAVGMGGDEGRHVRNLIGSLKGTIAKERAGTSMTPSELDLLESYIPNDNEDESMALMKANDFVRQLKRIKANRMNAYNKYGYSADADPSEQLVPGAEDDLPYSSYEP